MSGRVSKRFGDVHAYERASVRACVHMFANDHFISYISNCSSPNTCISTS